MSEESSGITVTIDHWDIVASVILFLYFSVTGAGYTAALVAVFTYLALTALFDAARGGS